MSDLLNKFGIYDLIAVLLSGTTIFLFSLLILKYVYNISIDVNFPINETLCFFIISYFLGLIFQEMGVFILKKIISHNNILLKESLKTSNDSNFLLTDIEKNGIVAYVTKELEIESENNENVIFNYCKFYVLNNCDIIRINRDQSLSTMSRSLSLFFVIFPVLCQMVIPSQFNCREVLFIIVSMFFAVILYNRSKRFVQLRYIYIFRSFYYNIVLKLNKLHR